MRLFVVVLLVVDLGSKAARRAWLIEVVAEVYLHTLKPHCGPQ